MNHYNLLEFSKGPQIPDIKRSSIQSGSKGDKTSIVKELDRFNFKTVLGLPGSHMITEHNKILYSLSEYCHSLETRRERSFFVYYLGIFGEKGAA